MGSIARLRDPARAEARREAILDAAIRTIAEDGLSATTMERVARRAGVSPGTVTFHFARKETLLLAGLDRVVDLFETARKRAMEEAGDNPARAIDGLVDASLDPAVSAPEQIAVWTAFWGEAKARRIYMDRVGAADAAFHADLAALVARLLRRRPGPTPTAQEVQALALGFAGLLDGLWQEALVAGRSFDRAAAKALARAYLAAVFPFEPLWREPLWRGADRAEPETSKGAAS